MSSIINLLSESKTLAAKINQMEQLLKNAPDGSLVARATGDGNYRYSRKEKLPDGRIRETYLNKSEMDAAVLLANKMLATRSLPELRQEKELIDKLIRIRQRTNAEEQFRSAHPGISRLLTIGSNVYTESALLWKQQSYNRNMKYPEQLRYSTVIPGLMVRSKSEADIIARLEHYGVPYHYDEVTNINGTDIAIDLKCLNQSANKIWYWDHRGMMDNTHYIEKTRFCDEIFYNAGILPGINLIITTETKTQPLDIQWVDTLIRYYLL